MKLHILNTKKVQTGDMEVPKQFSEPVREDLIRRAVLAIEANMRQRYGTDPRAGLEHSAELSRRRRKYRGSYGLGISRITRKIMSRSGTRFNWVGAIVPFTRGGRVAHPPKAEKKWSQKINVKERRKAIRSALAATMNKEIVERRGHKVPQHYPFIIDSDFESVKKTKEFVQALKSIGVEADLQRSLKTKTRGGAAKWRGRRVKRPTGPLIVVSKPCSAQKAARNIPGVEIMTVKNLNAKLLAPGCHPGRLTLYTKDALDVMNKDVLYM